MSTKTKTRTIELGHDEILEIIAERYPNASCVSLSPGPEVSAVVEVPDLGPCDDTISAACGARCALPEDRDGPHQGRTPSGHLLRWVGTVVVDVRAVRRGSKEGEIWR